MVAVAGYAGPPASAGFRFVKALVAVAVLCAGASAPAAAADAVTFWNEVASTQSSGRGPASLIDMAKVHIAIHDAVQAFEARFEPYCGTIAGASGSPSAAVAKAARDVLVGILPAGQHAAIDTSYTMFLSANGLTGNAGIAVGQLAAACILALRADDGSFPNPSPTFFGEDSPGSWRPTALTTTGAPAPMAFPWLGFVVPFALRDPAQLLPAPGPPALTSGLYTRDYNEVKDVGSLNSTSRTAAQTALAIYYTDNFPVQIPRALRAIAETMGTDLGENGRLFALAHIAAADAAISSWHAKVFWNFWRPITAIRQGDSDGNPRTEGDAGWTPFITTPNYPDYTSGANNLVSSMMRIVERFFGTDHITFVMRSNAAAVPVNERDKTYTRLSDVTRDVIDVRVYQGIHFRFADDVAYRQGMRAADWAFSHVLRPID